MTSEHFQTAIRGFQRLTPFRPYIVELVSGDRITVDHLEALVVRGGVGWGRGIQAPKSFR